MTLELKQRLISDILSTQDIDVLDIGERVGATGYIDFIGIKEITAPLMRGIDIHYRPFFTICADIVYDDGTCIPTFTTIFQRYTDSTILWHTAGHYRKILVTDGGMNAQQFGLFRLLIRFGFVDFNDGRDDESFEKLRLFNYEHDAIGNIVSSYTFRRPSKITASLKNTEEYRDNFFRTVVS